jgi:hypothetical protein
MAQLITQAIAEYAQKIGADPPQRIASGPL